MKNLLHLCFFCLTFSPGSALASFPDEIKQAPPNTGLCPKEIGASVRLEKTKSIFLKPQKININIPTQHVSSPLAQLLSGCLCFQNPPPPNSFYDTRCPSGYAAYVPCQGYCALQSGKYPYQFKCLPPR